MQVVQGNVSLKERESDNINSISDGGVPVLRCLKKGFQNAVLVQQHYLMRYGQDWTMVALTKMESMS